MELTKEEKAKIYEDYSAKVKGYLFFKVNDTVLAEDLCEDIFVKIYEKLDSFDDTKASLSTWIFTITRNTLIDYFRVRKVYSEIPEDIVSGQSIEEEVCNKSMLDALADALSKLDKRERDIIIFHYYKSETLRNIAEKMSISYAYVKVLHNKALENLKNLCAFEL